MCPSANERCQYILKDSKRIRVALESRMTADQKEKAKELADNWVKDYIAQEQASGRRK